MTYRTLKLQFKLDDEMLEALKDELLYSQPQVVDDEAKGLIWTGESETKPEPVSTQPDQPVVTPEAQSIQVEPLPTEPATPDAERRQLELTRFDGYLIIWEQGGIHHYSAVNGIGW
jgi:hypothetical protein